MVGMTRKPRKPRSGTSGPTVADVSRHAGVSPMTVSRVINCEPNVLPATRDKVAAAIAALGYVPNAAARSLAGGQQCRIALLHANPSAAYLSEFLMGSLAQASQIDLQLIVEHCDGTCSSARRSSGRCGVAPPSVMR
jgi:LacI family transcriptional regulator